MASAAVELTQQRSGSNLASKSTKSHVPMDMMPLNNPSDEKHNEVTVKCNHFSIRGYVSEVRKRDPKLCYPFSLKDSTEPIELPPMVVPQFRWWRCVGCVPEASVSCGANNKEAQKATEEIADTPLLLIGQSSKADVPTVRNAEDSTSIDSSDNRNYSAPKVFADPKGKGKAHVEDEAAPSAAFENGFLKDSSKELLQQSAGKLEVSLTVANEAAELGSRCNGNEITNALRKDSRVEGVEAESAKEFVNCNGKLPHENSQEKQVSLEACHVDTLNNDVEPETLGLVNGLSNESKGCLVNLPDLNECSGEPPYDETSQAMIAGSNYDVSCEDDDDYLGAERRKNPKVRLLSELLGVKETRISAKGRKKNPLLTNSADENVKKKRMGSQDEGSRSHNGIKMISETAEISESDSDYETDSDDVSIEIISKALAKRRCRPKIPLPEKRNKKGKIVHGGSSSMSRQKIISRSAGHEKGKVPEAPPQKSDVADQLIDRSSVLTKKRNKVLQSGKETTSLIPCKSRLPKEFSDKQKDEVAEKRSTEKVQKVSEAQLFPKSFVVKRNCQVRVPPGADEFCLPPSQAESMLADGSSDTRHQENRNNIEEASVAVRTTAVGTSFIGNPFSGSGERSTPAKTVTKERRARIPESEEGSPLTQDMPPQVSKPVVLQKELANEVQRRMRDIDINSIPADDKVTEEGPEDEIPMDIVELMAKNQYERHRSDPSDQHNYPASSGISGKHIRENEVTNSYGECWPKFGQQPHFLSMQNPPSTDARNYMANGNMSHVSDYNLNSLSIPGGLPRESSVSARLLCPAQGHEHSPLYPPPCGLAPTNWNGTANIATPPRYPSPSYLQAVGSYRYRACPPRQNATEGHVTWPSVVANRMPLGNANPQMIPQSSSVVNKGKIHRQSSGSILSFNAAPATTHLGKQQNLNFSNAYSIGHSESSAGSADMCANDAIPAMHLLSLMQNAAKNAALSLGPQKALGPTSSRQPFVENNSRSCAMQDNLRHPCYPTAIPAARPNFASSFHGDGGNIGRNSNTGFVAPIPLTLRGQRNIGSSHFAHPGVDHRPQRRQKVSSLDKGKDICSVTHTSYVNPLHGVKDDAPNFLGRGVRRDEKTNSRIPETEICQLNQNPSEFNDLRMLSRYMIGPDDLTPKGIAREKTARPREDAKRQDIRLNKPIASGRERQKQRRC